MAGVDPTIGDAGMVSKGDAIESRSMGGFRLVGQESDESQEAVDFLDLTDPARVLVDRTDWVLEQEDALRSSDLLELSIDVKLELELEDTESMEERGKL